MERLVHGKRSLLVERRHQRREGLLVHGREDATINMPENMNSISRFRLVREAFEVYRHFAAATAREDHIETVLPHFVAQHLQRVD